MENNKILLSHVFKIQIILCSLKMKTTLYTSKTLFWMYRHHNAQNRILGWLTTFTLLVFWSSLKGDQKYVVETILGWNVEQNHKIHLCNNFTTQMFYTQMNKMHFVSILYMYWWIIIRGLWVEGYSYIS